PSFKFFPSGILRTVWCLPCAGRVDQPTGTELNAICAYNKSTVSLPNFTYPNGSDYRKLKSFLILLVVFWDGDIGLQCFVFRVYRIRKGHTGQVVDAVHVAQCQSIPPVLPGSARTELIVQNDETLSRFYSLSSQMIRRG